jgi:hypothetical protein
MATSPNFITRATRKQALEERGLIRSQMRLGAGLILFGALSIPLFQVSGVLEGQAAIAALCGGHGRHRRRGGHAADRRRRRGQRPHPTVAPDQDTVADDQHGNLNAIPTTAGSQPGLQRAPITTRHPRVASAMPRTLRQLWADEDDAHER